MRLTDESLLVLTRARTRAAERATECDRQAGELEAHAAGLRSEAAHQRELVQAYDTDLTQQHS